MLHKGHNATVTHSQPRLSTRRAQATRLAFIVACLAAGHLATPDAVAAPAHATARPLPTVRTAPVGPSWEPVLRTYTGGYYGTAHVNALYRHAPRGPRRGISSRGHQAPCALPTPCRACAVRRRIGAGPPVYFGLTGYFPGTGTSGSFATRRAPRSPHLFASLYRNRYGRSAL